MRGMCLDQWMYASRTETTTHRSGPRPVAGGISSRTGSDGRCNPKKFIILNDRARPLTWRPILSAKSTKRSATCGFSELLPRLDITPFPRYSGYARVFWSSTRMNPANPARKEVSASRAYRQSQQTSFPACDESLHQGVEVTEYLMAIEGIRA